MTEIALTQEQEALIAIEAQMRVLEPDTDRYWTLKRKRNALRETTDLAFRHERGFGTRAERWAPLPWPDDTKGRWRVLREFIEAYNGVPLGDVAPASYRSLRLSRVKKLHKKLGVSVRQWIALVDELESLKGEAFRDPATLRPFRSQFLAVMTQGEGDYEWAIHKSRVLDEDPPVIGFVQDWSDTQAFIPQITPPDYGPYGSYPRLTDFIRAHLNGYLRSVGCPFDAGLHGGARIVASSPMDATYEWTFEGVWATPLVPRVPAEELLPGGWDTLSEELRTKVIDAFLVAEHPLDEVSDDALLSEAWKLDPEGLRASIADVLDVQFDIVVDDEDLTTRAKIMAFVQQALAERGD